MVSRIYLCAPVNAIVEGIYEEHVPFSEIRRHGDFGLGTFDMLDGEMVMLDGRIFQMTADGCVQEVGDDATTPFACVTFFRPERTLTLDAEMGYDELLKSLTFSTRLCSTSVPVTRSSHHTSCTESDDAPSSTLVECARWSKSAGRAEKIRSRPAGNRPHDIG